MSVILLDFNVSSRKPECQPEFKMMTKTGTVAYSAPEIFTHKFYDEKVDIWSAGVVLYMMLCGEQPFYSDQMAKLVHKITTEQPSFSKEAFKSVSDDAINLIKLMLTKDPDLRPSADECLDQDWFHDAPFTIGVTEPDFLKRTTSNVLDHAKSSLIDRCSLKKQGKLNVGEVMPVQSLMQDLLQNGIDFREIGDALLRPSSSVVFDKEAIFSIHGAL